MQPAGDHYCIARFTSLWLAPQEILHNLSTYSDVTDHAEHAGPIKSVKISKNLSRIRYSMDWCSNNGTTLIEPSGGAKQRKKLSFVIAYVLAPWPVVALWLCKFVELFVASLDWLKQSRNRPLEAGARSLAVYMGILALLDQLYGAPTAIAVRAEFAVKMSRFDWKSQVWQTHTHHSIRG